MKTYKVVSAAEALVIGKKEQPQAAIERYFDILAQECVDGWEFHSVAPVSVIRKKRKFKGHNEQYNAFIFVKDEELKEPHKPEEEEAGEPESAGNN